MIRSLLICVVPLSACAARQPLVETAPAAAVPPPAVAVPSVAPVTAITRQYHVAASQELPKVLAPNVSADTVTRIHVADLEARAALRRLEAQGRRYTAEALVSARTAVRRLVAVLDAAP